jgi:cytochrome c oxidase cbb3-type subunit 3
MSNNSSFWKRFLQSATKAKEIENENEILLDHDYDGIQELDNVLPPWWLWGFYITVIISIIYIFQAWYFDSYNQQKELENELRIASEEVEAYKAANPQLFDTSNLSALTDATSLAEGKVLFETKTCIVCHLNDGGGSIGPNLTDEYWINGGGFDNVYHTISKGGRPGKGMIAWETVLSAKERQLLASYVLSLKGTIPAVPKVAEGDIWTE